MRFHIDGFSSLDDVPKKMRSNHRAVLDVLRKTKRFSSFEMTEHSELARTIKILEQDGKIKIKNLGYPWFGVEVIDDAKARKETGT